MSLCVHTDQLVPAILAGGRKRMGELCDSDRSWVVAGLTLAGLTAEDIAHRLGCSLRLVRSIRAQDMTLVCKSVQTESEDFAGEVRLVRGQLRAAQQELTETVVELERTKAQLNWFIDAQICGARICGKCGTPMAGYNLYVQPGTNKEFCRECHRRCQATYRASKKIGPAEIGMSACDSNC